MADDPDDALSADETSVMLGCFAGASAEALAGSTGLSLARIHAITLKLASRGLVDPPPPRTLAPTRPPPPPRAPSLPPPPPRAPSLPPPPPRAPTRPPPPAPSPPSAAELRAPEAVSPPSSRAGDFGPRSARDDLVALLEFATAGLDPSREAPRGADPATDSTPPAPLSLQEEGGAEQPPSPPLPEGRGDDVCDEPPAATDASTDTDADADANGATREYQKLFQTELRLLPAGERAALAGKASGSRLFALCFDPDPAVIVALLDNPATTAEHARLIAFHHRTSRGIDELAGRAVLTSDALVHRRLLRNPSLGEPTLRRLMGSKRLLDVYKMTMDRDIPERTRSAGRVLFRARFGTAQPDERVDVVWATEGRVLMQMAGLTFDSRTTSILCSRNYASIMLIQNLTRFPATPPGLIAHLLKQPIVKRQVHLKNQLLSHPNTPSEAKRKA